MKVASLAAVAVCTLLLLSSCGSSGETQPNGVSETTLAGSWHASPSVGSGYSERYVFFLNGKVSSFSSESADAATRDAAYGTWSLSGDGLDLHFKQLVTGTEVTSIDEKIHVKLGPRTELKAEESPYPYKMAFNGADFWYYSSETELWPDEIAQAAGLSGTGTVTEEQALERVKSVVGSLRENETIAVDSLQERDGKSYYMVQHFAVIKDDEAGASHAVTRQWYFVDVKNGQLYGLDLENDQLMALQ